MYQEVALLLALLFVSSNIVVSAPIRDGLLPNGNFEMGPKPSQLKGSIVKARTAVPSWEITGFVEYIKAGQKQDDMVLVVPEGSSAVRLGNEASISQKISVLPGRLYSITFSAARTCAQDERLNISVTHESGVIPIQTVYGSDGWDSYSWAFKAGGPDIEIRIHNPGHEDHPACGPLIDAIAIKALFPPRFSGYNLIKNGNFEEGPYVFPTAKWGVLIPPFMEDDNSPLPGWIIESLKAVKYVDKAHFFVPEGQRAIELVGGKESAISQIVRTSVNKFYALSFNVGDARDMCEGPMIVEAFAGGSKIMVDYKSTGKGGFKRGRLVFKAVSARTRVTFLSTFYHTKSDHSGSMCGPVIDDVSLVEVGKLRG
ncbi:unnamed protein product [Microthlaspi erraticum]|uniref:DUF642 domain-containing protein n=1 Tax=Microthlaspi erraticum TaxID=1685480 RepID=A0A6D2IFU3_9BRAS|nr:unnamed protein product [Microthlaspi erraticum]CAA7048928.1 unnamed protein product [Microthlaspi erraticum]